MNIVCILIFLFTALSLYSNPYPIRITSDSDPQSTVAGCVNALSGNFFYIEHDIVSKRAGGLDYTRVYDSGSLTDNTMGYSWGNNFAKDLLYFQNDDDTGFTMVGSCEYDLFPFATEKGQNKLVTGIAHDEIFKLGYINSPDALLLGIPSFSKTIVSSDKPKGKNGYWEVKLPNGTIRNYEKRKGTVKYGDGKLYFYRLTQEKLLNGHLRHFRYIGDSNKIASIRVTNRDGSRELDSLNFSYGNTERKICSASGETIHYNVLSSLVDNRPPGKVVYDLSGASGTQIVDTEYHSAYFYAGNQFDLKIYKITQPNSRSLYVDYYNEKKDVKKEVYGKVKAIEVVLDEGKKPTPIYTFEYSKDKSDVFDPFGNKTTFFQESKRLAKITQGKYRTFKYDWDDKGYLQSKKLQTVDEKVIKCTSYKYDERGNLAEQTVSGNITGSGSDDLATHKFSTNEKNLRSKEILPNGTCYEYHYKPNTNLICKQFTVANGQCKERVFHTYDENSLLIKTIEDDGTSKSDSLEGVTYRLIREIVPELNEKAHGYTQPKIITEFYLDLSTGSEKLLKRIELFYNQADLVSEKRIFDANGEYKYSLFYEYNAHNKPIREVNALGEETLYRYDENDNLIYQEVVGSKKQTTYEYDLLNRLIKEEERYDDGIVLITTYTYDLLGNRLSTTDPYGGTTRFTYDAYGREIVQEDPYGHCTYTEYDLLDNPVKITDKEGNTTHKKYTIDGKPYEIVYPDGTFEKFVYFSNGNLNRKWNKDGTQVGYRYDYLDRVTHKMHYDQSGILLKQELYEYKGKNLIRETDPMGIDTHYAYDSAGRLHSKIKDGIEELYIHDSLGRVWETIVENQVEIKEYDFLDRVIEERAEDLDGKIYKRETFAYDVNGNKAKSRVYSSDHAFSETSTVYNGKNEPVLLIDAEGNETHFSYSHTDHFEKIIIDPLGKQTSEVYDLLNRIVTSEVTHAGVLLAKEEFFYSPNGNKIKQVNHNIETKDVFEIDWTYDPTGNVLSETEQGTKTTSYTYLNGRLNRTTKPDGVILKQTYDALGRIVMLSSSDGTIDYTYHYDLNDNLLNVGTIERSYDSHNRIIYEKQATGIEFYFSYDAHDQLQEISWDDNKIIYEYCPTALISAARYKAGQKLYQYRQTVDWRGKVIANTLPNGNTIYYTWDKIGRCSNIDSPQFKQDLYYDSVGNLIATRVNGNHTIFSYDRLYQLNEETGNFSNKYSFDSLNNRRSKNGSPLNINEFNQLIHDSYHHYEYDLNGNRSAKADTRYSYDALNRLTKFTDQNKTVHYRYDPLGRRYEKQDGNTATQYLYQYDTEIAAVENGKTKEFRAIHGQFSSFAFELDNSIYFPIRNHRGDTCALLDQQGDVVSTYSYDVFGVFSHDGTIASPWLFTGQRYDATTNLYTYAKRDYDPTIGRWLTPDPLGFADGPNLYAYVHNNPLIYIDPYGLWGESLYSWYNQSKQFCSSFSRGFIDDTTFGATSYMLGGHNHSSLYSRIGYYTGTGCSMAAGLMYGGTWLKGARYGGKAAINAYKFTRSAYTASKATKNIMESRNVVRLAQESKPLFQKVTQLAGKNSVIAPTGRMIQNTNSSGFLGKRGWELKQPIYQPVRNCTGNINGRNYSSHALDQMQNRGVMSSVIENTIKNGQMFPGKKSGTCAFYCRSNNVSVIIDADSGRVITTGFGKIRQ